MKTTPELAINLGNPTGFHLLKWEAENTNYDYGREHGLRNALKMSAAAALTPSRVFLICALVGSLTAATPRSTARHGPHCFKNLTNHAGGSSPVMARATFS
jgi:hypothetical protein